VITRRRLLLAAAATPFVLSAASCARGAAAPSVVGGARALPIPALATAQVGADGVRRFQLTAQAGTTEMLPGKHTPT
jgi:blue copper oxidase